MSPDNPKEVQEFEDYMNDQFGVFFVDVAETRQAMRELIKLLVA